MDRSWFDAMAADTRDRPDVYRKLGVADLRLVVEQVDAAGPRRFGLVLDGYEAVSVGELTDVAAFRPDAVVSGQREAWDDLAANIVRNGGADGAHSLNALTIADMPLRVTAPDPMGRDKFFRFAETLQTLFDALATAPIGA